MKKNSTILQMDLFSDFDTSFVDFFAMTEKKDDGGDLQSNVSSVVANAGDYLQKGERILNLAREKFARDTGRLSIGELEEKIFFIPSLKKASDWVDVTGAVASHVVRPLLRRLDDDPTSLDALYEYMEPSLTFSVELVEGRETMARYLPRGYMRDHPDAKEVVVTVREPGLPDLICRGVREYAVPQNRSNCTFKSGLGEISRQTCGDVSKLIANVLLLTLLRKEVRRVKALSVKEMATDSIYQGIQVIEKDSLIEFYKWVKEGPWSFVNESRYEQALYAITSADDFTFEERMNDFAALPITYYSSRNIGWLVDLLDNSPDAGARTVLKHHNMGSRVEAAKRSIVMHRRDELKLSKAFLLDTFSYYRYHDMLRVSKDSDNLYFPLPSELDDVPGLLYDLFSVIYAHKSEQVEEVKRLRQQSSDYAKSYQRKKNIPKKILAAMENSSFNNYFGFVEMDEDCDIEKVSVIADQFTAFVETYFPGIDLKDHTIRFRKLGNHKAVGLYYSSVRCLVVDIHCAESFTHEFGHLLDYLFGELSLQWQFEEIKKCYKLLLGNQKEKFKKGSKYNLDYYTKPTEIFARSFELYVAKKLQVNNSLLPENYDTTVYPADNEKYMELVTEYFDNFFTIHFSKEEAA